MGIERRALAMTVPSDSARFKTGSFTSDEWKNYWSGLTEVQRQFLRDKASWEHMTLSAVASVWGAPNDRTE